MGPGRQDRPPDLAQGRPRGPALRGGAGRGRRGGGGPPAPGGWPPGGGPRGGVWGAGFSLHSDIIAPYLVRLGTEAQKQKWLPGICRGEQILAVAITEPG